ncbi:glycosyltransferase [Aestuariibaculum sediminum]|uniref:Glycosyltransferase n=1 Tax=Aestuariibaculum sediminum TaxID=2770637 RepID=A0A8J6Q852_9FLAO|nr:glycosyltransferase [Aestuariibaculum sediminum]MBD0831207.1 glycosyltransferase [Aestuariibaculum sediminum]
MKKNNILIVDFNGTSSVYTHYLSNSLKKNNTNVFILGKKKDDFLDVFNQTNKYLGINIGVKLLDYILNWLWLILNFKKFDRIIIQWLQLLKYTRLEVYLINFLQNRIPLVYIVHNVYPHNNNSLKIKKRYNFLYKTCINIAVQTKEIKTKILEINPYAKIFEIQHGLFFRELRDVHFNCNSNKCLLVGYVSKYKGVEDAIKIAKILSERGIGFSLEIIGFGDPSYLNELNKMVKDLNLSDKIKFISKEVNTKFLIDKIKEASMLWLPYKNISQSGVAYTSIGLGIPFVAYNVGNFKDAFGGKVAVEIVEKGNINEFSIAVEKLLVHSLTYKKNIRREFDNDLWDRNEYLIENLIKNVE